MSGSVAERKRFISLGRGHLRKGVLPVHGHLDFFAAASSESPDGRRISVSLEGSETPVEAVVRVESATRERAILDAGELLKAFYAKHDLQPGDVLALERLPRGRFRLYLFETRGGRCHDWKKIVERPIPGDGPTVLELFAGCGGMTLGFKRAGFRTALVVEWDEAACRTMRAHLTDRVAQCAIQEISAFPKADVVAGGPPCQGFSNLGERVPNDPRRQLWRQYMRAVADAKPKAFVLENVPPLLSSQEYVEIRHLGEDLGYQVEGWILNAADYGVPQTRKRAIVIGLRGRRPTPPEPTHVNPERRGVLDVRRRDWRTVRDAIGDLPLVPTGKNWHIPRHPTPMSIERYGCIPEGGNRWNLPPHLMPDCWKRKTKGGTDLFGRLWWDRPSVTIRTEFYKPEKGRYLHPEADRPITHREAARLQGFPDDFVFEGSKIQVGVQIGNAVPPPLGEVVAHHVRALIENPQSRTALKPAAGQGR